MRRSACGKLFLAFLLTSGVALADYTLDFNVITPNSGSIGFAGGANPLTGTGISVSSVVTSTGVTTPCSNCFLTFTTGNLVAFTPGALSIWDFGNGGTISLSGTVGSATGTLFSGYFNDASVVGLGSTFKVAVADFMVTSELLSSYFTSNELLPILDGSFNLSFSALTNGQGGFTSSQMGSGDIFAGAPEPASIVLLGTVLLGCAALLRRRLS